MIERKWTIASNNFSRGSPSLVELHGETGIRGHHCFSAYGIYPFSRGQTRLRSLVSQQVRIGAAVFMHGSHLSLKGRDTLTEIVDYRAGANLRAASTTDPAVSPAPLPPPFGHGAFTPRPRAPSGGPHYFVLPHRVHNAGAAGAAGAARTARRGAAGLFAPPAPSPASMTHLSPSALLSSRPLSDLLSRLRCARRSPPRSDLRSCRCASLPGSGLCFGLQWWA